NATYLGSTNDLASQANAMQTVNLALSSTAVPNYTAGQAYSQQFSATGGSGNYSFALASGSTLPAGLTLSSTGLLSGMTTVAGAYNVSVKATDNSRAGVTGTQGITLTVNPGPLTVVVGTPSKAVAGSRFNATITIKDVYGNAYTGQATLSTSDGQAL